MRNDDRGYPQIDPQELDNWITGHYGNDQYDEDDELNQPDEEEEEEEEPQ